MNRLDEYKQKLAALSELAKTDGAAAVVKLKELRNEFSDIQEQLYPLERAFIEQDPNINKEVINANAAAQAGQIHGRNAKVLQALSDLGMTAASIGQIAKSNQLFNQLQSQRPGLAPIQQPNPQLTQALYDAQRGVANPNAVLDPAKQQLQQAYLASIQQNQSASGGQAGAFQGMNQVSNLQRMQGALGFAPINQDIRMQNAGNLNNLFGMRIGEAQAIQGQQAQNAEQAYGQYWNQAQAAGLVGSQGRANLLDATQRLAYHLGDPYGTYGVNYGTPYSTNRIVPPTGGYVTAPSGYQQMMGDIGNTLKKNLPTANDIVNRHINRPFLTNKDPNYQY